MVLPVETPHPAYTEARGLARCRRRPTPRITAITRAMPVMPSRGRRGLRGMRRVCSRAAAQLQPSHFRKYSLHLVLAGHRHAPLPHARSATSLYLGHSLALVTALALALALDGHRATECSSVRTVSVGGWGCVCVKHNEAPVQRYRAVSYIACCMLHAVCCLLHAACQCCAFVFCFRYYKAGQRHHAVRCYASALTCYEGKKWCAITSITHACVRSLKPVGSAAPVAGVTSKITSMRRSRSSRCILAASRPP